MCVCACKNNQVSIEKQYVQEYVYKLHVHV